MQMLLDLMEERQKWVGQRDEAIREISRLSELIRATMNMVSPELLARYEPIFERIEQRPAGLSMAIRACFTAGSSPFPSLISQSPSGAGKALGALEKRSPDRPITRSPGSSGSQGDLDEVGERWLTPVEIRDALKNMGFPFENYKANPLASIHTTLKRMVPAEMETKTLKDGQKVYRLKSAGEWARAFAETRDWVKNNFEWHKTVVTGRDGSLIGVRRQNKEEPDQKK